MAKLKPSKDFDKYIAALNGLEQKTTVMLKQVVYVGAGELADAVRKEIEGLPTGKQYAFNEVQKAGLLHGLGIASIRSNDGVVHTKIGMDGYNLIQTKKYPKGQPNAMIARSLISGTSFSPKNNFTGRAINKAKKSAEEAMSSKCDELIKKHMED